MKVAALFVAEDGPYFGMPDVDPWPESRDARLYAGPHPVVAHPPCQRWGRYWFGGPSAKVRRALGDDGGCFASALASVRAYGGVLEHPAGSKAWAEFGLCAPPSSGGWVSAGLDGGWTCHVEQGHYGHPARKATWLFANSLYLPSMTWGPYLGPARRLEDGFHSTDERRDARARGVAPVRRLSVAERIHTPPAFRDALLEIARGSSSP